MMLNVGGLGKGEDKPAIRFKAQTGREDKTGTDPDEDAADQEQMNAVQHSAAIGGRASSGLGQGRLRPLSEGAVRPTGGSRCRLGTARLISCFPSVGADPAHCAYSLARCAWSPSAASGACRVALPFPCRHRRACHRVHGLGLGLGLRLDLATAYSAPRRRIQLPPRSRLPRGDGAGDSDWRHQGRNHRSLGEPDCCHDHPEPRARRAAFDGPHGRA